MLGWFFPAQNTKNFERGFAGAEAKWIKHKLNVFYKLQFWTPLHAPIEHTKKMKKKLGKRIVMELQFFFNNGTSIYIGNGRGCHYAGVSMPENVCVCLPWFFKV